MRTGIKILMMFWTILGIFGIGAAVYFFITGFNKDGLFFLAIALVSVVMRWMNTKRLQVYGNGRPVYQKPTEEEKKKK